MPCKTSITSHHDPLHLPRSLSPIPQARVSAVSAGTSRCCCHRAGDTWAWEQGLPTRGWQREGGRSWAVTSDYVSLWVTSASITRFLLFDFGILILISFFDSFWFCSFLQGGSGSPSASVAGGRWGHLSEGNSLAEKTGFRERLRMAQSRCLGLCLCLRP